MNYNHLAYFRVLAKLQHYGKAAQALYISQPNLSYAMTALEERLGVQLFEKKGRNVILTKYGQFFAQHVENAYSEIDESRLKLQKMVSSSSGNIALSFFQSLGVVCIPSLIKGFVDQDAHKNVTFTLSHSNTQETIQALRHGQVDIGFCSQINPHLYPDLDSMVIAEQAISFIVSKLHPLAMEPNLSLTILNHTPLISFKKESGLRPVIDEILQQHHIQPNIIHEGDHGSHVAGLVAADLGIAIMPKVPLPELPIKWIPIKENINTRLVYMVTIKDKYQPDVVLSFREYILDHCHELLI